MKVYAIIETTYIYGSDNNYYTKVVAIRSTLDAATKDVNDRTARNFKLFGDSDYASTYDFKEFEMDE